MSAIQYTVSSLTPEAAAIQRNCGIFYGHELIVVAATPKKAADVAHMLNDYPVVVDQLARKMVEISAYQKTSLAAAPVRAELGAATAQPRPILLTSQFAAATKRHTSLFDQLTEDGRANVARLVGTTADNPHFCEYLCDVPALPDGFNIGDAARAYAVNICRSMDAADASETSGLPLCRRRDDARDIRNRPAGRA